MVYRYYQKVNFVISWYWSGNLVYLALSESKFYDHVVLDQTVTFMINQHCPRNHAGLALPERKVYDQLVLAGVLEIVAIRTLLLSTLSKNPL